MASNFTRILSSKRNVGILSLVGAGSVTAAFLLHREHVVGAPVRRMYPARSGHLAMNSHNLQTFLQAHLFVLLDWICQDSTACCSYHKRAIRGLPSSGNGSPVTQTVTSRSPLNAQKRPSSGDGSPPNGVPAKRSSVHPPLDVRKDTFPSEDGERTLQTLQ